VSPRVGKASPTSDRQSIRFLTWNLWAFDTDREARRHAITETLRALHPDICCLQEVRADLVEDFGEVLGDALGLSVERTQPVETTWWHQRLDDASADVTNVILTRWPRSDLWTLPLPFDASGHERRTALLARVEAPNGPLLTVCTQLTSAPQLSALRSQQVRAIAQAVVTRRQDDDLVVLGGDLNAEPDSDEVRLLCGHKTPPAADGLVLLDAWRFAPPDEPGWTWSRRNRYVAVTGEPDSRIDYILVGAAPSGRLPVVTSIKVAGDHSHEGSQASDHFAVVADLEVQTWSSRAPWWNRSFRSGSPRRSPRWHQAVGLAVTRVAPL